MTANESRVKAKESRLEARDSKQNKNKQMQNESYWTQNENKMKASECKMKAREMNFRGSRSCGTPEKPKKDLERLTTPYQYKSHLTMVCLCKTFIENCCSMCLGAFQAQAGKHKSCLFFCASRERLPITTKKISKFARTYCTYHRLARSPIL